MGVAHALGLRWWIEHEDMVSDVDGIFIYGDQGMILENSAVHDNEKEALQ